MLDELNRLRQLLEATAIQKRPCRFCGAQLYFIPLAKTGKIAPYTAEGVNHFEDCAEIRRRKEDARQQSMFEASHGTEAFG